MRIELITWHDAGQLEGDNTWSDVDEPEEDQDIVIKSVGWVLKETTKYVTIAMDISEDKQAHTKSRLPVGMIVSRKVLFDTEAK